MTSNPRDSAAEPNKGGRPPKTISEDQIKQVEALASVLSVRERRLDGAFGNF